MFDKQRKAAVKKRANVVASAKRSALTIGAFGVMWVLSLFAPPVIVGAFAVVFGLYVMGVR